jgi:hypothetical protein
MLHSVLYMLHSVLYMLHSVLYMLHSTDIIYPINIYLWTCSASHMFCIVIYGMLNKWN